jgi:Ca2+-binding EF-hand superfamily protein
VEKIEKERLQVMKTRFNQFVDTVQNGEKAMSFEAFIQSITNDKETKSENVPQELKVMFVMADLNGDGLINFSEYSFFLTLLSSSNERFRLAFEMLDKDGSGKIDLPEFMQIMNTEGVDSEFVRNMKSLPLIHQFFGKDCSGSLTFHDFSHFIHVFFF